MTTQRAALSDDLVGIIMVKLALTYGKRFLGSYDAPTDTVRAHWAHELAGLSADSVHYALQRLPSEYVPNVLQFRMLASQRPAGEYKALPAPQASPEVQQRALQGLRELREQFLRKGEHVDLRWAERIVANPAGRSLCTQRMARDVLKAHGRLQ